MKYKTNKIPKGWDNNRILFIYKKGKKDRSARNNVPYVYRTVVYKTTRILEQKVTACIEDKLEEKHMAFRAKRQTSNNDIRPEEFN